MPTIQHVNQALVSASFSPLSISGLAAWYDASDLATITEASGSVSQWDDKSGNGRDLTQGTGSAQPTTGTRTQNGLNVLDFDGGDTIGSSSFSESQPYSLFVVFVNDEGAGASNKYLLHHNWLMRFRDGGYECNAGANFAGITGGNTNAHLWTCVFNGASSLMRLDAANLGTGNPGAGGGSGSFWLGSAGGASNFFNGMIAEVAYYDSTISGADLTNVETYLNSKWAVY
jgi:hypothetical protein